LSELIGVVDLSFLAAYLRSFFGEMFIMVKVLKLRIIRVRLDLKITEVVDILSTSIKNDHPSFGLF
jgi:hypothetical protein